MHKACLVHKVQLVRLVKEARREYNAAADMAGPAETFTIINVPDNKVFVLTDVLAMNLSGFNVIAHISDGTEEKMVLRFFVDAKNVFSLKLNSGIPFNPSAAVIVETEAGANAEFLISGYLTTPEN